MAAEMSITQAFANDFGHDVAKNVAKGVIGEDTGLRADRASCAGRSYPVEKPFEGPAAMQGCGLGAGPRSLRSNGQRPALWRGNGQWT